VDKALHVNIAWSLAVADLIPDIWMLFWFSREILQLGMIPVLIHRFRVGAGEPPRTSAFGRATTILLGIALVGTLLGMDVRVATYATGLCGVLCGLHYAAIHLPIARYDGRAGANPVEGLA